MKGSVDLIFPEDNIKELFPALHANDPEFIATILASTRIVGMKCPGLHSIYRGLTLSFKRTLALKSDKVYLDYKVTKGKPRFPVLEMSIDGPSSKGSILCALRPVPSSQPSCTDIMKHLSSSVFEGQVALIIGGSRGFGEVTAKIIAAVALWL